MGKLENRENINVYGTDKEKTLMDPSNPYYLPYVPHTHSTDTRYTYAHTDRQTHTHTHTQTHVYGTDKEKTLMDSPTLLFTVCTLTSQYNIYTYAHTDRQTHTHTHARTPAVRDTCT